MPDEQDRERAIARINKKLARRPGSKPSEEEIAAELASPTVLPPAGTEVPVPVDPEVEEQRTYWAAASAINKRLGRPPGSVPSDEELAAEMAEDGA